MAPPELQTVSIAIRGPIVRADLPGLTARMCTALAAARGAVVQCDVSGVAADAVAVEALARLQLGAHRHGCRVHLRNTGAELRDLVELVGLSEVLPG